MFRRIVAATLAIGMTYALTRAEVVAEKLVVHEWGTFTSLQDENGQAVGGINSDDEPVPKFVHQLRDHLLIKPTHLPPSFFQGAPHCHPDVTLRLETPLVYFYPANGRLNPLTLDLHVGFRGGWLSEFYPDAEVDAPGLASGRFDFGHLTGEHLGSLTWKRLTIGGDRTGPETSDHVWTSPRQVAAASVTTPKGESEKFLFYRGVGHIDAPLRVAQENDRLLVRSQLPPSLELAAPLRIDDLWLVDIRSDGAMAFRMVDALTLVADPNRIAATAPSAFREEYYRKENLDRLRSAMRAALLHGGLFNDEAAALLKTWELSYFKSPGLRLFFVVPPAWVNHFLPLEVSVSTEVKRVMIGRIELITEQQRNLLRKIATGPASNGSWRETLLRDPKSYTLMARPTLLANERVDPKIPIPSDYRAYLDLGRFRNALLLEEAKRRPTNALKHFIGNYGLEAYEVK